MVTAALFVLLTATRIGAAQQRTWSSDPPPPPPRPSSSSIAEVRAACPAEFAECNRDAGCAKEIEESFGPRKWSQPPSPLLEKVVRCYRASIKEGAGRPAKAAADPHEIAEDLQCEMCSFVMEDMLSMIVQQLATDPDKASDGANGARKFLSGLCDEPRPMIARMLGLYEIRECSKVDVDLARLDKTRSKPCCAPPHPAL